MRDLSFGAGLTPSLQDGAGFFAARSPDFIRGYFHGLPTGGCWGSWSPTLDATRLHQGRGSWADSGASAEGARFQSSIR